MFFCTDGITEAGASDDQFGIKRIIETLGGVATLPGNDALHRLVDVVHAHEGTAMSHDDKTFLLAEYPAR